LPFVDARFRQPPGGAAEIVVAARRLSAMANFMLEQRKVQQQLAELEAWETETNAKIKVAYETYEATAEPLREAVEQIRVAHSTTSAAKQMRTPPPPPPAEPPRKLDASEAAELPPPAPPMSVRRRRHVFFCPSAHVRRRYAKWDNIDDDDDDDDEAPPRELTMEAVRAPVFFFLAPVFFFFSQLRRAQVAKMDARTLRDAHEMGNAEFEASLEFFLPVFFFSFVVPGRRVAVVGSATPTSPIAARRRRPPLHSGATFLRDPA